MAILERLYFKVNPGQFEKIMALEKEWDAYEEKAGGFPKKRRYGGYIGGTGFDTFIFEREWEDLATYEAANKRLWAQPEVAALNAAGQPLKTDAHLEFCFVINT